MKTIVCLALLAAGQAGLSLANSNSDRWPVREEETLHKTLTLSGEPMRLIADNLDGYVHVTGTNSSQVHVTAHKTIRAETQSDLQEAKNEVKLDMTEKPGTVTIYYDAPWRCDGGRRDCSGEPRRFYTVTYDIDIEAPRQARLVVSTINHGDIQIDGSSGDFDVRNINGPIRMTGIAGSGDAHTINGPILIHFARNPAGASSFKTINGPLDLYFRPGFSADMRFKTFNGEIYSDFDVTPEVIPATGDAEHRDGKFVYRSRGPKAARVGQGGPELNFETLNGSIRLHREQ
jgi:hypothetical protein